MGAWGTGIFDDDLAADVRGDWEDALASGDSPERATTRLIDDYAEEVAGDRAIAAAFWIALAAVQLDDDTLDPDVRDRAIAAIDSGDDLERWESAGFEAVDPDEDEGPDELAERRRVTAELRSRLVRASLADAA
ncbi:DUF4259 domain-containing protein [Patulibacter defluvii]|uniref:DUF4259 domain-containing protein n=1 Tax=Patulibacter defluvii TaxID=3095358 RepID=UPI002A75D95C|nr:DUF4259 domain-containing protein [Patulibacter sp. DM4]